MPAVFGSEALRPLSEAEFRLFRDLVYREAGIHLSSAKTALLVSRLIKRVRELGLRSFHEYYAAVKADPEEKRHMLERMCTHETHFFREPKQFAFLEQRLIPEWKRLAAAGRRPRRVRCWSAGCSSGEEPYSLAMLLLSELPPEAGWSVEIAATDLSAAVLEKARRGVWPIAKAEEIPAGYRTRFMLRGLRKRAGFTKAGQEVRSVVRFQQLNLHDERLSLPGCFDLVLCRNVLIYFDVESRKAAVRRLVDVVAPGGCLLLGHAETLNGLSDRLHSVGPAIYARPT